LFVALGFLRVADLAAAVDALFAQGVARSLRGFP